MELPKRKPNRLIGYDYSKNGAYFVTICTKNKEHILWDVGAGIARPNQIKLSKYGEIIENAIINISQKYSMVNVDKYVVMPNHIHMLLSVCDKSGRAMLAPTISQVVQQFKGAVTKQIGQSVWQKLFHDHIIRNQKDYSKIWEYIDHNPQNWERDCFYSTINPND